MTRAIQQQKCPSCNKLIDDTLSRGKVAEYHKHCKRQIMLAKLREKYAGIMHVESCRR